MEPGVIDPWLEFFKNILDMPIPENLTSSTEDRENIIARNKHVHWKIKGMAAKITYRMFAKYGDPEIVEQKDLDINFSKVLVDKFVLPTLHSHLSIIMQKKTNFVGSKTLNIAIKYLKFATKLSYTMEQLKPHIQDILY